MSIVKLYRYKKKKADERAARELLMREKRDKMLAKEKARLEQIEAEKKAQEKLENQIIVEEAEDTEEE